MDIAEPSNDDPEVRKEAMTCAVATEADDPIEKLTSHYSHWLKLCKAVAWMRLLADWIHSKKCQTGYLQAPELQAVEHVEYRTLQWLQPQIGVAYQPTRGFTHGGSLGKANFLRRTVSSGQRNITCCRSATLC